MHDETWTHLDENVSVHEPTGICLVWRPRNRRWYILTPDNRALRAATTKRTETHK